MEIRGEGISMSFPRADGSGDPSFALQTADITLREGELTVLEGRSGSGKTTLLSILSGLQAPSGGRVLCAETDLYSMDDDDLSRFRNERFGIIPQGQSAVSSLTVLENILLPCSIRAGAPDPAGRAKEPDRRVPDPVRRAEELMEQMGISALRDVLPRDLSGGELRRMAVARALIMDPQALFADEPTSDLDDGNTEVVFDLLKRFAAEGKTVLAVTHERHAGRYADRILRMDAGILTDAALQV